MQLVYIETMQEKSPDLSCKFPHSSTFKHNLFRGKILTIGELIHFILIYNVSQILKWIYKRNTNKNVTLTLLWGQFNFHSCLDSRAPADERCRKGDCHLVA